MRFARPADALAHGVAMIYQELSLAPHLTVAENIFLGREPLSFGPLAVVNRREMNERAARLLAGYGFKLDARARVGRLSAADRQLVEIARATAEARRVIVMDEPTSSLTAHEVEELFRLIRDLKARGLAVIYISHRLEELERIADRLTILRDGRAVYAGGAWGELSRDEIIRHMAGRELKEIFPPRSAEIGGALLRVERLTRAGKFEGVSFEARAGEVVGPRGTRGRGAHGTGRGRLRRRSARTRERFIWTARASERRGPTARSRAGWGCSPKTASARGCASTCRSLKI